MSDTAPETASEDRTKVEDREVSLRLDGVTKRFEESDGKVVAVDNVSMDIYDGEFVVFVGPSGCGKTTTLRMVAGLEDPSEGRVEINGENVAGRDPRERNVAMVFQNYALYPHKTVRENLAFPLTIRKYPKDERQQKVEETAEMLGIGELLDRQPRDLSGGQQQRVALGRAIIRDPELFLFDEPLSNLDAKLRIQMRTELNKLHRRVGKTSVYVTHDQEEAMTLGDRVAVMNDGRLQQIAPPQQVYEHPANRFVAGFIGEPPMNFFDVELSRVESDARREAERNDDVELSERGDRSKQSSGSDDVDGDRWLLSEAFELALPDEMQRKLAGWEGDPKRLVFGIRPEDLQDAALLDHELDARRSFRAYVKVVEPMGSNVDLTLAPPGATDDESSEFTARVSNDTTASEGDTITVGVDVGAGHVFDGETGDNLTQ